MKMKKIYALIIALLCVFTSISSVYAVEETLSTQTNALYDSVVDRLIDHIEYKYGDVYSFENINYEIQNVREDDNYKYVDINIITDMTLTQHPSESNYVIAMREQAKNINDENTKAYVDAEIDAYVAEIIRFCYNVTEKSVFKYTAKIAKGTVSKNALSQSCQLMYRVDVTDDECIVTPMGTVTKVDSNYEEAYAAATDAINSYIQTKVQLDSANTVATRTTVVYDRIEARDYALEHATDEPEFSAANQQGSDCANFVSKALNAGGFPVDYVNDWHPSSNGTTATCGINWMRTGYYNNGGVVPYMVSQGYFYEQTNENRVNAGSIMYWNSSSHVALVTYGDTVTIKYTQHSNYKLPESVAKNIVYESENAKFYMPDMNNVTVVE